MEQEEGREMPDGVESQTGYCRFCGQAGMVHTLTGWSQEDVDEAVTCKCECDAAKKYTESKERVQKAKSRITELFGSTAERPIDQDVVTVMLNVVDAIEAKWSYVKKKYKLNVPNFHVPAGQVSLQEPQQILPLLSDILLRTD